MSRPAVKWVASPNFRAVKSRKIWAVIIHSTATSGIKSPLEWLTSEASKVSAHYLIDRDGDIFQLVDELHVAWHAGTSSWAGAENVNNFSIGIELVNANDGIMTYPEAQLESLRSLVVAICKERNISSANVVGHYHIAPGRKTDPLGFPFDDFKGRLYIDGVA